MSRRDEAVQQVLDAWLVEGPVPEYHRAAQHRLERDWPTLANALKTLALENVPTTPW